VYADAIRNVFGFWGGTAEGIIRCFSYVNTENIENKVALSGLF